MTAEAALRRGAERLAAAGVPDASWDAELLLRHVLGWNRATLLARGREPLPSAAAERFFALLGERERRRPLQHLTGAQPFWRHEFLVTPDVLIPRPETELLVAAALELLGGLRRPVVVDVGTGSGCIAISLSAERPDAIVHAVDVSSAALAVARENARRLGVEERVTLHEGDLLSAVRELEGRLDLAVSNPPYVEPRDLSGLQPEVRDHEPPEALLGEDPPYGIYRRLASQAALALRPGGWLVVEVGQGMADEVARICARAGLDRTGRRPDLQGIERVVLARRPM